MNWTFATLVSDKYVDSAMTLIYSIQKNSKIENLSFLIMHSPKWCQLSSANMGKIESKFPFVSFLICDESYYYHIEMDKAAKCFTNQNKKRNGENAKTWLLKFELMRKDLGYDKIVWIDSDMLCLGDIRWLAQIQTMFGVVVRNIKGGKSFRYQGKNKINAGLMVLGKKMLNLDIWRKVLNVREGLRDKYPSGDQIAWQQFFTGKTILALPRVYNDFPVNHKRAKIIHYFGEKTNEKSKEDLKDYDYLWLKYKDEMCGYTTGNKLNEKNEK